MRNYIAKTQDAMRNEKVIPSREKGAGGVVTPRRSSNAPQSQKTLEGSNRRAKEQWMDKKARKASKEQEARWEGKGEGQQGRATHACAKGKRIAGEGQEKAKPAPPPTWGRGRGLAYGLGGVAGRLGKPLGRPGWRSLLCWPACGARR